MLAIVSSAACLVAEGLYGHRRELVASPIVSSGGTIEALVAPALWDAEATVFDNINGDAFVPFMRAVIETAECDLGLTNYHMRLSAYPLDDSVPPRGRAVNTACLEGELRTMAEKAGCIVALVGDCRPVREVSRAYALEERDRPITYTDDSGKEVVLPVCQRDLLVAEGDHCAVFLDAQARPMYVSVLTKRFERRQRALSDVELAELWRLPMAEAFSHANGFVDARINAGDAQNVAHVHLKVWLREEDFTRRWGEDSAFQALRHASKKRKEARAAAAADAAATVAAEASSPALSMERPYDTVTARTLAAVGVVTDFEVGLFRSEGWVVLRRIWDPEDDETATQPARLQTLKGREKAAPRDDAQYELAAGLAARMLRAPALADPAGGTGLDNAFDHYDMAHCMEVPKGKFALVIMPTDDLIVGLQGYSSQVTSSDGDEPRAREFELNVGDALILDDTCCRGCPLGVGGDQLVHRFVACAPGSRGVLWRTPREMVVAMM